MSYLTQNINDDVTVDPAHIQENDAALDNAISGNLTELNFSSATRVPNSMLASPNCEQELLLQWEGPGNDAVWPAASTTVPADILRINGSGTYTILGASYTVVIPTGGTGGGNTGSVSINAGTLSGTNFASSTTLVSTVAMTTLAAAGQTASGDFTLAATSFTAPIHIAALSTLIGGTSIPRIRILLRVTRSLQ